MSDEVVKLVARPGASVARMAIRLDARRDTGLFVQRNVDGYVHITIGKVGSEATLILHPHFGARLMKGIAAVLAGEDFAV